MANTMSARDMLRTLLIVLIYGALVVVFETQPALVEAAPGARLWAPLAGVHLALLVVFGLGYLPVVLGAVLAGGLLLSNPTGPLLHLILPSLIVVLCYGAAAAWLRRALGRGPHHALRFVKHVIGVALVLSAAVSVLTALSAVLLGRPGFTETSFSTTVFRGWIGEALGLLTIAPLLLLAVGPRVTDWLKETMAGETVLPRIEARSLAAFGLELGSIALALYLALVASGTPLYFFLLLPLLWIAWRHGLARAVLAVFLINAGLVVALQGPANDRPWFMMTVALMGLVLGALVSERSRTRGALSQAYDAVGARLEARTLALHDAQRTLEAQIAERQHVEETLQASVDDLERAMQQQSELNDRLRASEQQLKDLNARKDKFFSIISHDVKSVLVSAIGFSKLLVSDADTLPRDMVKEFASHVHSSTTNTYDLLENLLTWTRMQTGRMYYQRAWHDVNDLIQNNIVMLRDNAARKGIQLNRQGDRDAQVYADRNMINSVLQNLISNAIKFTERGGEVTVASHASDHTVEISVRDTGVGISPENLDKLFRIDENLSTTGTEDEEGTGLGLVLCKEMIEKHEGRIWAESEPGRGSAFYFTLPCAAPAEEE